MLNIKPKYVVNEKGRKTATVLSMEDYRSLMQRLQDLEDALELDRAVETATDFREYTEIQAEIDDGRNRVDVYRIKHRREAYRQ